MTTTLIQLKINNRPYTYDIALTIFQACLQKRIYVPRFCYHVALKIAGNCRMCLIEEKSSLKPVASCAVTIVAGMHIYTQTEMVKKAREGVIEYLLINHPLDCPICDQGGECDLQDQTMVFGADRGRFYEAKRTTVNKNLGFLVKTFLNRCIHCARCTRFLYEVAGSNRLSLLGRGYKTEISTYIDHFLTSEISGNIIDLCPVGALTSKPYAFKARPWELVSVYMYDIAEPFGANIELNYRGLELMRILPRINYEINGEWISDKTRFFYDAFMIQRLTSVYRVKKGTYRKSSWLRFFTYWKSRVKRLFYSVWYRDFDHSLKQWVISAQIGEYTDLETVTAFKNLFSHHTGKLLPRHPFNFSSNIYGFNTDKYFFSDGDDVPGLIILLNVNLRLESPVLNIKIRKLLVEKFIDTKLVGFYANLNYEVEHFVGGSTNLNEFFKVYVQHKPLIICGSGTILSSVLTAISGSVYKVQQNFGAVSAAEVLGGPPESLMGSRFRGVFRFLLGQPDWKVYRRRKNLNTMISLLHHVEDVFWTKIGGRRVWHQFNAFKLPTKFYLEKISSYYSESGYFFSTIINIAGYTIRGTREEWRILSALLEISGIKSPTDFVNDFDQNFGRRIPFNVSNSSLICSEEKTTRPVSSVLNNYYEKGLLSRISPVLSLCAKAYVKKNDYQFLTFE